MQQSTKPLIVNLIRHAQSEFNLAQENYGGAKAVSHDGGNAECKNIKFNDKLFDAGITELGFKQTLRARESVKDKNIKLVIVSPLKRALQTCQEVFKGHKNSPKVIVHPLYREMCLSNCDIGSLVLESKENFSDMDFSFLDKYENPKLWVLDELADKNHAEELKQKIKQQCKEENLDYQEYGHFKLLEHMKNLYPQSLEQQKDTNVRSRLQREVAKQIALDNNIDIENGEQIAIVGHSRNLQAVSATKFNEDDSVVDGVWLENCEVKEIYL